MQLEGFGLGVLKWNYVMPRGVTNLFILEASHVSAFGIR